MKKKMFFIFIVFSTQLGAFEFKEIKAHVTTFFKNIFENAENDKLRLPEIPKVVKDPKSIEMYKTVKEQDKAYAIDNKEFLKELFTIIQYRKPDERKMQVWLNVLRQGGSREGVYRGMVLGDYYYDLESREILINKSMLEFTKFLFKEYLKAPFKRERVKKINFFTLKRLVVEKFLEVFDSFQSKEELILWYASISGSLSRRDPPFFSNWRKNKSMFYHKEWAENTGIESIRSEVIIKIHKAYNILFRKRIISKKDS
jgi:hypothetical protein